MRHIERATKRRFFRRSIFVLMLVSILIGALNLKWIVTAIAIAVALGALHLLLQWDLSK